MLERYRTDEGTACDAPRNQAPVACSVLLWLRPVATVAKGPYFHRRASRNESWRYCRHSLREQPTFTRYSSPDNQGKKSDQADGLTAMDHSPLSKLPPELRSRIYEYVLLESGLVRIRSNQLYDIPFAWSPPPLLGVCRQLDLQGSPIYYQHNLFSLCGGGTGASVTETIFVCVRCLSPRNRSLLGRVVISGFPMEGRGPRPSYRQLFEDHGVPLDGTEIKVYVRCSAVCGVQAADSVTGPLGGSETRERTSLSSAADIGAKAAFNG